MQPPDQHLGEGTRRAEFPLGHGLPQQSGGLMALAFGLVQYSSQGGPPGLGLDPVREVGQHSVEHGDLASPVRCRKPPAVGTYGRQRLGGCDPAGGPQGLDGLPGSFRLLDNRRR
ncbi:hypothetical protein ACFVFH_09970 [Streptomyces sp. NPDC057697]|uniref:hypothetical protein n=1 Tax=Streptomyces sp. NPDC057697 TaxID=3346219 RepID=UPI0036D17E74